MNELFLEIDNKISKYSEILNKFYFTFHRSSVERKFGLARGQWEVHKTWSQWGRGIEVEPEGVSKPSVLQKNNPGSTDPVCEGVRNTTNYRNLLKFCKETLL